VNANPSGSRAPWAGRSGGTSFRDVAIITGPPAFRFQARGFCLDREEPVEPQAEWVDGARRAKKAGRGVPGAWQTAQGRVGLRSRHFALHLGSHRLLLATTSAFEDAERPRQLPRAGARPRSPRTARPLTERAEGQPLVCPTPQLEVRGAPLFPSGDGGAPLHRGQSRGKGVLAA
jgi:hypothetical protein